MIQSIYSSVTNAKCQAVENKPIPLLKTNYLGEYKTEIEKAKVRQNLGISDEHNLQWGNIKGFIEEQHDLIDYVESQQLYQNEISEDIITIKDALDYTIQYIANFKLSEGSFAEFTVKLEELNNDLSNLESTLSENILNNSESINIIKEDIKNINDSINLINETLQNLDVDSNISNWVSSKLENSKSINFSENTLSVKISNEEGNAISILDDGLFVKDQATEISGKYDTTLSENSSVPTKVGGIDAGTKVSDLKGKTFIEIFDTILFPSIVRNLVYPTVNYSSYRSIVKVGDPVQQLTLIFTRNDAGPEISRTTTITFNNTEFSEEFYNTIGTYKYKGVVTYEAGEYLTDNKGQVTDKRVEAGSKEITINIDATYPWYAGNTDNCIEQTLIKFNQNSGDINITLSGENACIKLPGENSTINSFKADGGMGFLDVDLDGWIKTIENINGISYQVWTKSDSYSSNIPHKINFKLQL